MRYAIQDAFGWVSISKFDHPADAEDHADLLESKFPEVLPLQIIEVED